MISESKIEFLKEKAKALRHHIIDMIGCKDGKVGHLGGSCSIADITAALYFYKMKHDPKNPKAEDRDRFLLSKGHAALAQYAALSESGYFSKDELLIVKNYGSMLQGHPDMTKTPGIEANTGSLGQGLSIGLGMALGLKRSGSDRKAYVVMGDGELAEGQLWEAAMAAASFKADNLVGIVDANLIQATGAVKDRMDVGDIKSKWAAFGWHVIEIDGHKMSEICEALDKADEVKGAPVLILAHTVKGKCISFAEGQAAFHNGPLSPEQYEQAHKDVEQTVCY
ncbi:MAG: transketolase [Christensenellales bacterium]|jgi:transketolase